MTNEVLFIYDGNLVFQERDQNDMTLTTYTRGNDLSGTLQGAGGIGGLLARSDRMQIIPDILSPSNPDPQWVNTAFYHSDGSGNVTALVQLSGLPVAMYQYDPYGNILAIGGLLANENKYRFSSKEWNDNADLYYYGYRFYDPNLQRWLNRDPIQESGGINLFNFVDNSSLDILDPYGLCDQDTVTTAAEGDPSEVGQLARQTVAESNNKTAQDVAENALNSTRKQATDDLAKAMKTPKDMTPHHNIPYEFRDDQLVDKAAEGGWNLNGANNGTNLPRDLATGFKNINRWHRLYNKIVGDTLKREWNANPNMTAQEAAQKAQEISNWASKLAQEMCKMK